MHGERERGTTHKKKVRLYGMHLHHLASQGSLIILLSLDTEAIQSALHRQRKAFENNKQNKINLARIK